MGSRVKAHCRAALVLLLAGACAPSPLADFRRTLAAQDSATAALGQWCAARALAADPAIRASLIAADPAPVPAMLPGLLALPHSGVPGYRHVRLSCGNAVLSEAHNWYVRERLTPAMNHALDTSDIPFGKAVAALRFTRQRLGEARGAAFGCPRGTVLSHRARLHLPDGTALAYVVECYTARNLARPA